MTDQATTITLLHVLTNRRNLSIALILYLISQVFFLICIQFPKTQNFDEFHYVPSAKQFLAMKVNQNWEHPPLGKILMAGGIALWGDRPIGWRFMSTFFGALTLVGMYFFALVLFKNERIAIWATVLTLFNQLLYVQARIGMLDTFMFAFLIWALVFFCLSVELSEIKEPKLQGHKGKRALTISGVFFGLALSCKWFSVIPIFACLAWVAVIKLLRGWGVQFKNPQTSDWYTLELWKGLELKDWAFSLVLVPLGVYFLTFLPFVFIADEPHQLLDILIFRQIKMYEGQLRVVHNHPYMSHWLDWPLLKRPIWYAFDREGPGQKWVRGVLLIGNPLVMWTGLIAILVCFWDWIHTRSREAFIIAYFYSAFFLCWIFIPRKVAFYYYYYPAGMFLSFALAYLFRYAGKAKWIYLGASIALFVYFFPILAGLKIPSDSFRYWMWFSSWI